MPIKHTPAVVGVCWRCPDGREQHLIVTHITGGVPHGRECPAHWTPPPALQVPPAGWMTPDTDDSSRPGQRKGRR